MDAQIVCAILCSVIAIAGALTSIVLKSWLDRREADDSSEFSAAAVNPYAPLEFPPPDVAHDPAKPLRQVSRLQRRWVLIPVATVVAATMLGMVARLLRPYANFGGTHYEALAALVILLFGCVMLVGINRRHRGSLGHWLYQSENVAMWSGFTCGWSLIHGEFWEDMVGVCAAWWFGCAVLGTIALLAFQKFPKA